MKLRCPVPGRAARGGAGALLVAALVVTTLAGCGIGPGAGPAAVQLRVTHDFGTTTVRQLGLGRASGLSDMQLLQRHFRVGTQDGGASVRSIDGASGTSVTRGWFFYVNGIQAAKGPTQLSVRRGDHVWFDLHDARASRSISAVVGAFPEPFAHGVGGRRYPSTISCSAGFKAGCAAIAGQFDRLRIPLSGTNPGYGATDVLSLNVGTWRQLSAEVVAELLRYGPEASGVYARFVDGGRQLDLENVDGQVVRRLGAGAGLVAAVANSDDPAPTWLVTGTDRAGVRAAVAALTPQALAGHFALAIAGTRRIPVPVAAGR